MKKYIIGIVAATIGFAACEKKVDRWIPSM